MDNLWDNIWENMYIYIYIFDASNITEMMLNTAPDPALPTPEQPETVGPEGPPEERLTGGEGGFLGWKNHGDFFAV